jgi:hypothetical protein
MSGLVITEVLSVKHLLNRPLTAGDRSLQMPQSWHALRREDPASTASAPEVSDTTGRTLPMAPKGEVSAP